VNAEERAAWLALRQCPECPGPNLAERRHLFDPQLGYSVIWECPEHGIVSVQRVVDISR
jgi:hypothetical protein